MSHLKFVSGHVVWQLWHKRSEHFINKLRFRLTRCDGEWYTGAPINVSPHLPYKELKHLEVGSKGTNRSTVHWFYSGRPCYTCCVGLGQNFILIQCNARLNTAAITINFIHHHGTQSMEWPALSPDLNLID